MLISLANADIGLHPKPIGISSPQGSIVVRIIPGIMPGQHSHSKTERSKKFMSPSAKAKYYYLDENFNYDTQQIINLVNPQSPSLAYIFESGELVTVDNWPSVGVDPVIVVYQPDGTILKKYNLSEIYSEEQIKQFTVTALSRLWRCPTALPYQVGDKLSVFDVLGGRLDISVSTDEFIYTSNYFNCECEK